MHIFHTPKHYIRTKYIKKQKTLENDNSNALGTIQLKYSLQLYTKTPTLVLLKILQIVKKKSAKFIQINRVRFVSSAAESQIITEALFYVFDSILFVILVLAGVKLYAIF